MYVTSSTRPQRGMIKWRKCSRLHFAHSTHFCNPAETLQQMISAVLFLQRETINHIHIVTNSSVVVRVTVIKGAGGKVFFTLSDARTEDCSGRVPPWTPVEQTQINLVKRTHVLTLMTPGNGNQCPRSAPAQPLGSYLMSSLIHLLHCPLTSPRLCTGTHLWEAKIMGPTLSSIEVWWMATA